MTNRIKISILFCSIFLGSLSLLATKAVVPAVPLQQSAQKTLEQELNKPENLSAVQQKIAQAIQEPNADKTMVFMQENDIKRLIKKFIKEARKNKDKKDEKKDLIDTYLKEPVKKAATSLVGFATVLLALRIMAPYLSSSMISIVKELKPAVTEVAKNTVGAGLEIIDAAQQDVRKTNVGWWAQVYVLGRVLSSVSSGALDVFKTVAGVIKISK